MDIQSITVDLLSAEQADDGVLLHLEALINRVYQIAEADFWQDDYLRTDVHILREAIKKAEILTASCEGEIVAGIHISPMSKRIGKFGMLAVLPKYEGFGIGRLLVKAAEAHAISLGCDRMRLDLLTPVKGQNEGKQQLHKWYTRLGYTFLRKMPFEKAVPSEAEFLKMPCFFNLYEKKLYRLPN
ncbi:MAG: hypothetical protein COB88_03115 [Flavobacteriales bacterium]|nr:MAG: hypothetical protein COB88_03115 [Flavobacteriales bacterium]